MGFPFSWKESTFSKMSRNGIFRKIRDFLKRESFPKSCRWKKIRNNNWNFSKQKFGDYDDALLIYGVPKFMTVYAFRRNHLWQFFFFISFSCIEECWQIILTSDTKMPAQIKVSPKIMTSSNFVLEFPSFISCAPIDCQSVCELIDADFYAM